LFNGVEKSILLLEKLLYTTSMNAHKASSQRF
jgi:hypothetical protein